MINFSLKNEKSEIFAREGHEVGNLIVFFEPKVEGWLICEKYRKTLACELTFPTQEMAINAANEIEKFEINWNESSPEQSLKYFAMEAVLFKKFKKELAQIAEEEEQEKLSKCTRETLTLMNAKGPFEAPAWCYGEMVFYQTPIASVWLIFSRTHKYPLPAFFESLLDALRAGFEIEALNLDWSDLSSILTSNTLEKIDDILTKHNSISFGD